MIDGEGKYLGDMASSHLPADVASRLRYREFAFSGFPSARFSIRVHPRESAAKSGFHVRPSAVGWTMAEKRR
tara:strand:- start:948 stop:1163 length:216 start_codon:yes stop_codon:yes gene_type:complete